MRSIANPRACVIVAILALAASRSALADEHDEAHIAYRTPAEIRSSVRVIALAPVFLPPGTPEWDAVAASFEALVTDRLESSHFRVLPSSLYQATWTPISQRIGGVFDPATGHADRDRLAVCREHTARELARTNAVDAVMVARVYVKPRLLVWSETLGFDWIFERGPAVVFGENVLWDGKPISRLYTQQPQRVEFDMLDVDLEHVQGQRLYHSTTGIEWRTIYRDRSYRERASAVALTDAERNSAAVQRALTPLLADGG